MKQIKEAADSIKKKVTSIPETAIILGSGLGPLADNLTEPVFINYQDIPHFPASTAPGHKGRLVFGRLTAQPVLVMQGRFHYYEGYDMSQVVLPIRVMKTLGVKRLIITNAAGGINREFKPGDLMMITDHIKFGGDHPLRGPNLSELGPRFNDMSQAYTRKLQAVVKESAREAGMELKNGVYAYMTGPSYETPAEIQMLRILGADAVGMSTVPEVLTAAHCGLEVIGISCISNMAAGIFDQPITENEVFETGKMAADKFRRLLEIIVGKLGF